MRSWESSDSVCDEGFSKVDIVDARSGKSSAKGLVGVISSSSSEDEMEGGLGL